MHRHTLVTEFVLQKTLNFFISTTRVAVFAIKVYFQYTLVFAFLEIRFIDNKHRVGEYHIS